MHFYEASCHRYHARFSLYIYFTWILFALWKTDQTLQGFMGDQSLPCMVVLSTLMYLMIDEYTQYPRVLFQCL